jgi:hypothetical protein
MCIVLHLSTRYYPILITLENFRQIFEKYQILNFMKIRPVEVVLSHADGRTDRRADRHEEGNSCFFLNLILS